ncbi:UDP-N-acetylmuramoylalanyl-D-glutamate--2,6-diaminopimelate ligase [Niastella koreensis]|uniref:UDP-N-acetylmuramoyl-tripeptide--D-alanyl-D-alanine ligase n=2 Tax=Niastella koreensis TaxID=354356 RepID=G8TQG6_NIAKG|nr:UDP-N-acetylmuramoyl-tripeptide--D-alanyl-D-alanine ligase [Niastella koreensis]AEW03213.1 UDP-N-acetylmuramoyl-tripeptide--D-alanyl-D-alanine ligase [Niastella koreensis GR20-10]OQP55511.1 UDP-N-acetylmuramoylalanyl-D-glutamate--2,6-diaminopimelate ligase [Niastella koreensis]
MTIDQLYKIYRQYPSVQTDTRKLKTGDLFFALKGPNFNGNEFALAALAAGSAYAVVDDAALAGTDSRIIVVDDVLTALQQLAKHHRQQFNIPFIAITGSNGKTTTKELVYTVLSAGYKTYTTQGNLNNHIGIPLTILSVKDDAEIAVIEMGANHLREIASYCEYTLPTHGIITNCGKAHLEGFGSIEGVRKGKGELYDYLRANNGTVFVMWDYDYLQTMSKGIATVVKYGTTNTTDIQGAIQQSEPFLTVSIVKGAHIPVIQTQLVGAYNLPNVLVAVTAGRYFNVPDEKIKKAIEHYTPSNSRSQLIEKDGNKFILDAYNANPTSMRAAIENFANIQAYNKVLMLGGMAELGAESLQEHEGIINLIKQHPWKAVVLVGGDFLKLDHPFIKMANSAETAAWFKAQSFTDTYFLIKGSRSMQMEKVLSS